MTTIDPNIGCWIQYQLKLRNITQSRVARKARCSSVTVSQFLKGYKNCERLKKVLTEVLGYEAFEGLLNAYERQQA
jgi:transcriptional regulator with XRE-family HTH domain